jgi:hypothetical protein
MSNMFCYSNFSEGEDFDFEKIRTFSININCRIDNAFNFIENVNEYSIDDVIEILNNFDNGIYLKNMLK